MHIYKSQPTGDQVVPDLVLNVTEAFPRAGTLEEGEAKHRRAAKELADLLDASLPGGTLHCLLVEMLNRKLDQTVVRWDRKSRAGVKLDLGGTELGVPNIDAADDNELDEFAQVFTDLVDFVCHARDARRLRRDGLIQDAIRIESDNERIYASLPPWARW